MPLNRTDNDARRRPAVRIRSSLLPGGPLADWRLGRETDRVQAQCRKPRWGKQLFGPQHEAKPAASLEAPPRVGNKKSRARVRGSR